MSVVLRDRCGRRVTNLRVSVTDRCNLRCRYCMPEDWDGFVPRDQILSFEEITRTLRVASLLGVDRVRLTGGEPLLRRGLADLIAMIKRDTDVRDVALTTNALLLGRQVDKLVDAGLDRINVSLDSLRPDRFEYATRFDLLEETWEGIRAASDAGFRQIKINTVIVSDFNHDELDEWLELTRERDLIVRFLEVMPIGEGAGVRRLGGFFDLTAARRRLADKYGLEPAEVSGNGPARYWRIPGAPGLVGFITPLSDKYCDTCSRFRLTSTGQLRACLAYDIEVDISEAIREGDEERIYQGFLEAAATKPDGHEWSVGQVTRTGMSSLGG